MAISYVSSSAVVSIYPTTRTTTTVAMPVGAAAGDLVLISVNAEITGSTGPTITPPGSVTALYVGDYGKSGEAWNTAGLYAYRVIGTGDPSGFAFTHAAAWTDAAAVLLRGVDASTPVDAGPTAASGTGTSASFASVTTLTAAAWLVGVRWSWDGNAISPPAGWTERIDQAVTWIGHVARPSAGATGAITVSSGNGSSTPPSPWLSVDVALRPAGSGTTYQVAGITAAITTAIGVPTSYQKINATTISTTTTNGGVISYNEITGNSATVSTAVGGPSSYQEINAVDGITTTAVGSTVFKGQAQGTQSLVSETSGNASIVSGSITYSITGNIPITTETNASPSTCSVVLGSVSIQSQISGAVSVTGVPIWDIAGTVVLTSVTSATVVQHTALTGTVPVATTISGTITARSIITSLVSVLSGIIGNTNVISAVAGSSASTATVSGTVRIFGSVGLPQTMTLHAQASSVNINGSSPQIVLSEDERSIVLQARYNEITLEAH